MGRKSRKIVDIIFFGIFVLMLGIVFCTVFPKTKFFSWGCSDKMQVKAISVYIFQPWVDIPCRKDVTNQKDIVKIIDSLSAIACNGTEKDNTIYYGAWNLMFMCQNEDNSIFTIFVTVLGGEEDEVLVGRKADELYHGTFSGVGEIWETIHASAKEISREEWAEVWYK